MIRPVVALVCLTVCTIAAVGCSPGSPAGSRPVSPVASLSAVTASAAPASPAATASRRDHVVIVMLENKNEADVRRGGPYLASLAAAGATLTDMHGAHRGRLQLRRLLQDLPGVGYTGCQAGD